MRIHWNDRFRKQNGKAVKIVYILNSRLVVGYLLPRLLRRGAMNSAVITGLVVGGLYGYIAQRGAFCLNSGFRFVVIKRDYTKVKALLLAIAVQMLIMPAVFALGWAQPTFPS